MHIWQYKLMFIGSGLRSYEQEQVFNEWGRAGWEFTGHTEPTAGGLNYFMKRPAELEYLDKES